MSKFISKSFFNKRVYVSLTVLDVHDIKNLIQKWRLKWSEFLQKIGLRQTPEELIGNATPYEIMDAWKTAMKNKGKDLNDEFVSMFNFRGSLFAKSRMLEQVKWFQNWTRRTEEKISFTPPVYTTPIPLTPEQVAMQKIGTAFINGVYALPHDIQREVAVGVLAALAEKFKD